MAPGRNTHPTNTAQHPGNPDMKRHHRTKAEMEKCRAEEAKKRVQEDLDQKAKIDRIASVEQRLTDELNVTPRPAIKQRLRRTTTFLELPPDGYLDRRGIRAIHGLPWYRSRDRDRNLAQEEES
jgi:hypothetical protein